MRAFYRLTDQDDSNAYAFQVDSERMDVPYRMALATPIGADGAFDLHGDARSPLDVGRARIDLTLTAATTTALDTVISTLLQAARGSTRSKGLRKLWRHSVSDEADARFTWARLASRPDLHLSADHVLYKPVSLDFRLPDPKFYEALTSSWLTANGYTPYTLVNEVEIGQPVSPYLVCAQFSITTTPYTFTLKNAGALESRRLIFLLRSMATPGTYGMTNPKIENLTTGQEWSSTRDSLSSDQRLSVNCSPGLGRARWTTDGGAQWFDDSANLSLGATQAVIMELQPGDNSMRYTDGGTPNLALHCWWLHAYED
jgi:hypothetical protein